MESECPSRESNLTYNNQTPNKILGEPAVVVNGLPDVNPVRDSTSQLDAMNENESDIESDHCFGVWMEGREVKKMFGENYYVGKVVKYDREMNWYRVVYEDGDFEDLDWHELEEVLVAIDISYPLKKLALRMIKNDNSLEHKGSSGKIIQSQGRYGEGSKRKNKQPKSASKLKGNRKKNLNRRVQQQNTGL